MASILDLASVLLGICHLPPLSLEKLPDMDDGAALVRGIGRQLMPSDNNSHTFSWLASNAARAYLSEILSLPVCPAMVAALRRAVDPNLGVPVPCDKGTYSPGGTDEDINGACTPCPQGFTTQNDEAGAATDCEGELPSCRGSTAD